MSYLPGATSSDATAFTLVPLLNIVVEEKKNDQPERSLA